jgi:hypothetical protein
MTKVQVSLAGRGFTRLLETLSGDVEQPTVEWAPQSAVLATAEAQIHAAVRTFPVEKSQPTLFVSKQHQLFAE